MSIELAWYSVLQTEGHDPLVGLEISSDGGWQHFKSDLEWSWIEEQISANAHYKGIVLWMHTHAETHIYMFILCDGVNKIHVLIWITV